MNRAIVAVLISLLLGAALVVASVANETTETDEAFDRAEYEARMARVAAALLDSPEPGRQVAGLLLSETSSYWHAEYNPRLGSSEFLDRLHTLIDDADTALTRALLAQLCAQKALQVDCRQRGLDEAIVAQDGAELLARLYLTEPDESERLREVIVAAERLDERYMDFALILFDAIKAEGGLSHEEHFAILYALQLGPSLGSMAARCQQATTDDPDLDRACVRLLQSKGFETGSIILTMVGSGILARRAEAAGDVEAVARHEQWRADHRDWMACFGSVTPDVWETADSSFMRQFINHWQAHGEASAQAMVAARGGVDCGPPPRTPWSADKGP